MVCLEKHRSVLVELRNFGEPGDERRRAIERLNFSGFVVLCH